MLKTLWRGWLVVARKVGHFQSQLVLTLVYFVAVAPFAVAVRLFSDPLGLRGASSWHWAPEEPAATPDLASVRRQF